MKCVQMDFLLIVSIVLLIHIKQPVCSHNDEYRFGWPNRLRHHHIPDRYTAKQQVLTRINLHTSITRTTSTPFRSTLERPRYSGSTNRKVDQPRHVFRFSSATHRPLHHNKSIASKDHNHRQSDDGLSHWPYKSKYLPAKSLFSLVPTKTRLKPRDKERFEHFKDDDYYYYDGDDNDYAPAERRHIDFEVDEEEDVTGNNAPWRRTTVNPKKGPATHQAAASLIDDYTFDYLDDDPTNIDNEKHGSLTEEKWRNYGTAEAVESSRRRHMSDAQIVSAHITRIHLEAMCKQPRPKIIQISDASKRYVPHCTVLHRCGDDTGCCHSDIQTCAAKKTTTVDLYFYVIPFGSKDPVVETLPFINHTECHCVDRFQIKNTAPSENVTQNINSTVVDNKTCHCVRNFNVFEEDLLDEDVEGDYRSTHPLCRCDCLLENQTCIRLKRGLEGFSVEDRRCISDSRCSAPNCQYGNYNIRTGRCPRSQGKRMVPQHTWTFD